MEGIVNKKKIRINQFIKVPEVRLINFDGTMIGIVKTTEALSIANDKGLDLVEISSKSVPPLCKIVDFLKFKYEIDKKEKLMRKKSKIVEVKEFRIKPRISEHDLSIKIKHARKLLCNLKKVQFTMIFTLRELQYKDLGIKIMCKIKKDLLDISDFDESISFVGMKIFVIFMPKKNFITNKKES
ncbi:MAG: translation initiation factor IF-3 [Endomicrobium sp.]|nr:translation initiation factor IF-3 [Endomicrobium sp.]